ncbi:MAG: hypothetical protein PUE01_01170 [Clostridiaceae bacterium]|nr:hypothetical protein [Clostridiaceae bacterium]
MERTHIYLIFSKTGTWLSKSISFTTNSSYTHVALSLDDKFNKLHTFGRIQPNKPFTGGFVVEDLFNGVYTRPGCKCLIYKIPIEETQLKLLKYHLMFYTQSTSKYKYNFLGLFAVLMGKSWKRADYYFCSQFICELFHKCGIWTSPKAPELTRPTDLLHISEKEIIFEGLLQNYTTDLSI